MPDSSATPSHKRASKLTLRFLAIGYLVALLLGPIGIILYRTFEHGLSPVWKAATTSDALHAFQLTFTISAIAVVCNIVFGVIAAIAIERHRFRGHSLINSILDLPFAVSPVIVGLALILLYGDNSKLGGFLTQNGIQVIFSTPGMILATIFVSLPFVAREVIPVLREVGTEQEEAAQTLGANSWQTFWRVTFPSIRWGLTYGVVLASARAIGEFGAVSVVSGKLQGQTETLTLYVEQRYQQFDLVGAYTASVALAFLAVLTLATMKLVNRRKGPTQ